MINQYLDLERLDFVILEFCLLCLLVNLGFYNFVMFPYYSRFLDHGRIYIQA